MSALRWIMCGVVMFAAVGLWGCAGDDPEAPPAVRFGDDVCVACNMILSDRRFTTATVAQDERGRARVLLFDDFNCQARYEAEHSELVILRRWAHDYDTMEWIAPEHAHFVRSDGMHTPMASFTAAYAARDRANVAVDRLGGEVLGFGDAWERLTLKPCCAGDHEEE